MVKRTGIPPIIVEFVQHLYMVYYTMFKVHKNVKVETKSAYLRKRYVTNSTAQDCKAYATQLYIQTLCHRVSRCVRVSQYIGSQ